MLVTWKWNPGLWCGSWWCQGATNHVPSWLFHSARMFQSLVCNLGHRLLRVACCKASSVVWQKWVNPYRFQVFFSSAIFPQQWNIAAALILFFVLGLDRIIRMIADLHVCPPIHHIYMYFVSRIVLSKRDTITDFVKSELFYSKKLIWIFLLQVLNLASAPFHVIYITYLYVYQQYFVLKTCLTNANIYISMGCYDICSCVGSVTCTLPVETAAVCSLTSMKFKHLTG